MYKYKKNKRKEMKIVYVKIVIKNLLMYIIYLYT